MTLSRKTIDELSGLSTAELMQRALQAKLKARGDRFSLCSIINAKSGKCSEDCRFCVQSAHYETDAPIYPLKKESEIIAAATEAKQIGAQHFSLVTSGRGLPSAEVPLIAEIITAITEKVQIPVCASLGIMSKRTLAF